MRRRLDSTAAAIGRGLVAGLVGTAAMTLSSSTGRRLGGGGSGDVPARAAATVLGIEQFEDEQARSRTNQLAHWAYGTGLGAVRGLLGATRLGPNIADTLFHGVVWGSEQVMLPALGLAPPATEWDRPDIAADLAHHTVYSLVTNGTYRLLSGGPTR